MSAPSVEERLNRIGLFFCALVKPWHEVFNGVQAGTLPWLTCLSAAVFVQLVILFGADAYLFRLLNLGALYPSPSSFPLYYVFAVLSPFYCWGIYQVGLKRKLTQRLTNVFDSCGLRNRLGKFPNFVFDKAIDSSTRKLRLTRAVLDMEQFKKAKGALEGGLQVFIDEFRENREHGTVDIIYANKQMPSQFKLSKPATIGNANFVVGTTRSAEIKASLNSVPHLLVAGQTGGGKSTFLRQFITTLFLNDRKADFLLVDLKGGMEFQIFEKLPRVVVPETTKTVIHKIERLTEALDSRMKCLKDQRCTDIQQYFVQAKDRSVSSQGAVISLNRKFVVIDEAAEMFLAGHHADGQDVQKAKRALSKVARQGRAVGIHLIVATQRPDSRALDPQIKANLTGALCFQMANDISSITVLGNGRASDLPAIAGRAIWKVGGDMVEVQTPLLSSEEAEKLLEGFYEEAKTPEGGEDTHAASGGQASEAHNSREDLRNG